MKLLEALRSGRRFKHPGWDNYETGEDYFRHYACVQTALCDNYQLEPDADPRRFAWLATSSDGSGLSSPVWLREGKVPQSTTPHVRAPWLDFTMDVKR